MAVSAERRYAEDTQVPVDRSRGQIETMLKKVKASRIILMDDTAELVVAFFLSDRAIKIAVIIDSKASAQVRRSTWRALHMIIKAKLEAVAQHVTTVEQEFLAHIVLPEGQTVGHWMRPQLQLAFDKGQMPRLMDLRVTP